MVKGKKINDSFIARWAVLLFAGAVLFFNYYFYDAWSPLKDLMQTNPGFLSTDDGLFTVPNVFLLMTILGGIILDKIGMRITGFFLFYPLSLACRLKTGVLMDLNN